MSEIEKLPIEPSHIDSIIENFSGRETNKGGTITIWFTEEYIRKYRRIQDQTGNNFTELLRRVVK